MNQTHPTIEHIVEYLHGELSPAQDATMHAHLATCPQCEERREAEVSLTDTLRVHARAGERELPPSVVAAVRTRIAQGDRPTFWDSLRALMRPVMLVPVAAAIALMVYAGFMARHTATGPVAIDASAYVESHAAMAATTPFSEAAPVTLTSDDEAH